jgi:hypothetical protein
MNVSFRIFIIWRTLLLWTPYVSSTGVLFVYLPCECSVVKNRKKNPYEFDILLISDSSHHQILLGRSNQGEWGGGGKWHAGERGETCTGFWWESPKEKDHLKDQGVDGRMGQNGPKGDWLGGVEWIKLAQVGIVGGLLWMRWWTFGFWRHGIS